MLFYFLMVVRYVRIKQQCRRVKIAKLLRRTQARLSTVKALSETNSHQLWTYFKRINVEMSAVHEEIRGHNQYWSKFITLYFVVYMMEICYLSYAFFFVPVPETSSKIFFGYFSVEFTLLLLYVTLECSRVVSLNVRMHRDCLRMALEFTKKAAGGIVLGGNNVSKKGGVRLLAELLQLDDMAANSRNVSRICFKWTNNYRINSQMFELVSSKNFVFLKDTS